MRRKFYDKGELLEIIFAFPDVRVIDLEIPLHLIAKQNRWEPREEVRSIDERVYRISDRGSFLTTVRFTHGLEPPTWAYFENKQPGQDTFVKSARASTIWVAKEFLEECAHRGLIS